MKKLIFMLIPIIIFSCASQGSNGTGGTFSRNSASVPDYHAPDSLELMLMLGNTMPREGEFILAGISPRYYQHDGKLDKEREFAKNHGAKQLALHQEAVIVSQQYILEYGKGSYSASQAGLMISEDAISRIVKDIEILQETKGRDYYGAVLRYKSKDVPLFPQLKLDTPPGMKPYWINKPPKHEKYYIELGVSGRISSKPFESWEESDKKGMARIAEAMGLKISSEIIDKTNNSRGNYTTIDSYIMAKHKIEGLYVVSRWREPDSSMYYSLVIKKK